MKQFFLLLAAMAFTFSAFTNNVMETKYPSLIADEIEDWTKTETWVGKDGKTIYKYDKALMEVKYSTDGGKKWEKLKENKWQDKDGQWLKIHEKKVQTSSDGGNTWTPISEAKWQGGDNRWYKFDSDWNLWKM